MRKNENAGWVLARFYSDDQVETEEASLSKYQKVAGSARGCTMILLLTALRRKELAEDLAMRCTRAA